MTSTVLLHGQKVNPLRFFVIGHGHVSLFVVVSFLGKKSEEKGMVFQGFSRDFPLTFRSHQNLIFSI